MALRRDEDERLQNHIYSLDIDLSLVRELARKEKNISFSEADATEIQNAFYERLLKVNNSKTHLFIYPFLLIFLLSL